MGMSFNKKDAQTNAARDLGQHLIREGLIAPADLPQLSVRVLCVVKPAAQSRRSASN
jgi:hypothetical protein